MNKILSKIFERTYFFFKMEDRLRFRMRYDQLMDRALTATESGTSSERYCDHEVIVSLTSYSRRILDVAATIESVMQGSVKPNRIVLWLGEDMQGKVLPVALQRQQQRGLEVDFCKDILSYTKLIPSLKKWPEALIITIDDDALYRHDLVENLLRDHRENPNDIISGCVYNVEFAKNKKELLGFRKWLSCTETGVPSLRHFLMGVSGVLYPPHCLHEEVFNEEVFTKICKYADDIWFYAMAVMKGTKTVKCMTHTDSGTRDFTSNPDVSDMGLWRRNDNFEKGIFGNDAQMKAVFDHYGLYDKLREE